MMKEFNHSAMGEEPNKEVELMMKEFNHSAMEEEPNKIVDLTALKRLMTHPLSTPANSFRTALITLILCVFTLVISKIWREAILHYKQARYYPKFVQEPDGINSVDADLVVLMTNEAVEAIKEIKSVKEQNAVNTIGTLEAYQKWIDSKDSKTRYMHVSNEETLKTLVVQIKKSGKQEDEILVTQKTPIKYDQMSWAEVISTGFTTRIDDGPFVALIATLLFSIITLTRVESLSQHGYYDWKLRWSLGKKAKFSRVLLSIIFGFAFQIGHSGQDHGPLHGTFWVDWWVLPYVPVTQILDGVVYFVMSFPIVTVIFWYIDLIKAFAQCKTRQSFALEIDPAYRKNFGYLFNASCIAVLFSVSYFLFLLGLTLTPIIGIWTVNFSKYWFTWLILLPVIVAPLYAVFKWIPNSIKVSFSPKTMYKLD